MIQQPALRQKSLGLFPVVRGNARVISITEGIAAISFRWYAPMLSCRWHWALQR